MTEQPFVEFEAGSTIANDYINKLHTDEMEYSLVPMDEQPADAKHFILRHKNAVAMTEIILSKDGTWTSIVTMPVYESPKLALNEGRPK